MQIANNKNLISLLTVVKGVLGLRFGLCFRRLHLIRGTSLFSVKKK